MTLSADLEASFSGGGSFDLAGAFGDLADLFDVELPALSISAEVNLDVSGLGTGDVALSADAVMGGLGQLSGALPDVAGLLAPLEAAMRLPELVAAFDFEALRTELEAAIAPSGPGLGALVDAAGRIGTVPIVGTLTDLLGPLGLDLRAPGGLIGGVAGGAVSLITLIGALCTVEATSRRLADQAELVARVVDADRLAGVVARVRAAGGRHLADLLTGIDPDDLALVDLIAPAVEEYLSLLTDATGSLMRAMAFAEVVLAEAELDATVVALGVASAVLVESAVAPVRDLVGAVVPLVAPLAELVVPDGGIDALFGAVTTLSTQMAAAVDALPIDVVGRLVGDALAPVLTPLQAVEQAIAQLQAVVGAVFDPVLDALHAVDLSPLRDAINAVVGPVSDAITTVNEAIAGAQDAIEDVVGEVHDVLEGVRDGVGTVVGTITAPFLAVQGVLGGLDLVALQEQITTTVGSVRDAIAAAPVQPVFDVAVGIIDVAADALGLVPKALLPDDLRQELEAACAPVEALDLEPTRVELHQQLATMIDSIDASALEAVAQGFQAVQDFLAEIDPRPHLEQFETDAFDVLRDALDQLDPEALLAPVLEALTAAQEAIAAIDLAGALAPIDAALDQVLEAIDAIDVDEVFAPVQDVLDTATGAVRDTLALDEVTTHLDTFENGAADLVERIPVTGILDAVEAGWADLVAELRGDGAVGGGVLRGLTAALVPDIDVGGLPEVLAWISGERDGTVVVRDRLTRAATSMRASVTAVAAIDVPALTAATDATHAALVAAVAALPATSHLRLRLAAPVAAARPAPTLGLVVMNQASVDAALARAAATLDTTTPPDRTEVQQTAAALGAAFTPFTPAVDAVRRLGAFVGLDTAVLFGPDGLRLAVSGLAEQLGPAPLLGPLRAVADRLRLRATELLGATLAPLRQAIGTVDAILDGLSTAALVEGVEAVRDELTGLVDGVRPSVVLAEPLAALTALQATLATFDPLGPVRLVVEAMRAEVDAFAQDLAPTTLLAPVLAVYGELTALVGAFDVAGLIEPVLQVLDALAAIIDRGIDAVIDSLTSLKAACESEGGVIPGLDLSIAASVDVGGGFGL